MDEKFYLLDNNALGRLTITQRASVFVQTSCRIPTEVLYEARGFPDRETLQELEYPTTARVLRAVQEVMSCVEPSDVSLVNLYDNLGYADPFLIACALDGLQDSSEHLFGPSWLIVTNDKGVSAMAVHFELEVLTSEMFADVLAANAF